jgi:predicted negative regulator of RcsB-dependent stress response
MKQAIFKFSQKIKDFWRDNYEDIISGIIVFLLVSFAFGLGVFLGSKFYEDSQININCPPQFWEEGG